MHRKFQVRNNSICKRRRGDFIQGEKTENTTPTTDFLLTSALIKDNLYHKYLEQRNLRRAQVLKKGSQPIMDYYDEFYTATVTVGTPGQNVSLLLDTSMSILWVIDAKCGTGACNGYLGSVYTRRKYNASKSSTVSPYRNTTNLLYPSGWLTGPVVKDTVSFAGLTIEQQGFVNAADISDAFGFMPLDGFLGLSWQQSSDVAKSPMENLLPSLDAPIFTVWLDRKLNVCTGGDGGLVTYGAIDTTNCESEINYVALSAEGCWQFPMEGFSIGSFTQKEKQDAICDTSSSWIGAPFRVMNEVVSQTGALFDYENEMYTVNCSTMMQQPDLEFIINGIKYTLPSKEYIVDIELGEGKASALPQHIYLCIAKCVLAFTAIDGAGYGAEWILGTPWIRTYCNIHDFGQARIGFAKAKHSE
ncbi:hypothetical protein Angca_010211 [Angiostrongylus cantonensis]|nr:hypothetical protein Angca_010211 [Angiostrongylus cantonensis]